jgi:Sulfotransferase family
MRVDLLVCDAPVFVIGSPRSGTSVLAWALAQHSRFWTSAESDFLYHLYGHGQADRAFRLAVERADGSWIQKQKVERAEFMTYLGLGINALFTSRAEGKRWVDQSPTYTLMVDTLAEMFPEAFFLHILRDGRRVVSSMLKSGFGTHWSNDFREACRTWAHFVRLAMTFCETHRQRSLTVVNEEMGNDPARTFQHIFNLLGAPYEPGSADFVRSNRINSSYSVGPPATPGTVVIAAEPWKEWNREQETIFNDEAGSTLTRYGLIGASEASQVR